MHPVLKSALGPLAAAITVLSVEEAQVAPTPGQGRWCAQQVLEHLILSYELTSRELKKQIVSGRVPRNRRNLLEFLLRMQTIGLAQMPFGIPTMRALRPLEWEPESGAMIAARFLEAAESMDALLVTCRKTFGIQACGEHPFFGVMRVDEWRRYHAVHARHHLKQLKDAIRSARSVKSA
jgi:hypothetical protein